MAVLHALTIQTCNALLMGLSFLVFQTGYKKCGFYFPKIHIDLQR